MNDVERLVAIEAIKQVKAKYFYGLDHQDWDLWRAEVFTSDASLHIPERQAEPYAPLEKIIAFVAGAVGDQVSIHHGHMPIIRFTSDVSATAIWAMEDRLYRSRESPRDDGSHYLHGFGHYHETYVRSPVGWRIATSRLTRLRVESRTLLGPT